MSFVISEQARELSFQLTAGGSGLTSSALKPTVGPNVGPGSYYAAVPAQNQTVKGTLSAPFGTSTRRRLNLPHQEMLQDLTQFRFLP